MLLFSGLVSGLQPLTFRHVVYGIKIHVSSHRRATTEKLRLALLWVVVISLSICLSPLCLPLSSLSPSLYSHAVLPCSSTLLSECEESPIGSRV